MGNFYNSYMVATAGDALRAGQALGGEYHTRFLTAVCKVHTVLLKRTARIAPHHLILPTYAHYSFYSFFVQPMYWS
jgi:hypothetical protein